jgi:hypothetical protein
MLKEIAIITIAVANPAQVERAWNQEFGYTTVDNGAVSTELAELWDAPDMAGEPFITMVPANSAQTFVRLVREESAAEYTPMTSHGWNATELLVSDTDAVAEKLRESDFTITGEPKDLWPAPDAPRAMQAIGPGNELLYLTTNTQAVEALGLNASMPLVERAFIMVLGGSSMQAFSDFYGGELGMNVGDPMPFKITSISKANDLPIETTYPLAMGYAAPGYMIEFDELPTSIGKRDVVVGRLPPGVAIVGFNSPGVTEELEWVSAPRELKEFPYRGRKVGILRGPAGELVEVILK